MSGFDDRLLKHFLNPKNVGKIEDADGYARVENPVNGYTTDIYIKINNGKIADAKFKSIGCTATIATASAVTEIIKEKNVEELINPEDAHIFLMDLLNLELGEIPEKNWHCLPTIVNGVFIALYNYYNKTKDNENVDRLRIILVKIKKYIDTKLKEFTN